ncbi:hypothetical protein SVIO_108630 [Streptomyces violaceusniger]|uniref:Uncharacterized protein n=1 Tax=Streptomyces violaceusniger TaxID=68280 RepID=A0A4D4LLU8_STRVO|nr:hypothetical protein SVIO_108630 [Streptomyces violaceusniger]
MHRLIVVEQDADGQDGSAVGQVDTPGHLVVQGQDAGETDDLAVDSLRSDHARFLIAAESSWDVGANRYQPRVAEG